MLASWWRRARFLSRVLLPALLFMGVEGHVRGREPAARVPQQGTAAIDADQGEAREEPIRRVREGSVLKRQTGSFTMLGDRIVFQSEGEEDVLMVLENLMLERVWKVLQETSPRQWIVSGSVTEYRGRNYLLLERAVVRAQSTSPSLKMCPVRFPPASTRYPWSRNHALRCTLREKGANP